MEMEELEPTAMASFSVAEIRSRLLSLETERHVVQKKRALEMQRLQWIETRQQQDARLHQLLDPQPPSHEPVASPEPQAQNSQPESVALLKTVQSKRELMEELREQTRQVVKKQVEVATKMSDQLRSLRQNDRPAAVNTSRSSPPEAPATSPSASPPASSPAAFPARRSNKLVLVLASSSVLGKRRGPQSSTTVAQVPSVHYPALVAVEDVACKTPTQLASLAFRVATRHFLQTGTKCSIGQLKETLVACTSKQYTEDKIRALVQRHAQAMQLLVGGWDGDAPQAVRVNGVTTSPLTALTKSEVQSLVEAEKKTLDEMITSWTSASPTASRALRLVGAINAIHASSVLGERSKETATSLEMLLANCLGISHQRDVPETAYPHLSPVWKSAMALVDSSHGSEHVARASSSLVAASTTFGRPFDLDQSVMKQIQRNKRRRHNERADPMKVMCMFELSGVCNDANCPYQHQRDFDERADGCDDTVNQIDSGERTEDPLMPQTTRIALNQFMQLREDLSKWWPSPKKIFEQIEPAVTPTQDGKQPRKEKDATVKQSPPDASDDSDTLAANQDFLELGSSSSEESGDDDQRPPARYCLENGTNADADDAFSDLQQHVATNPEDADAWLLLALRCLRLEISWSDDQARLSSPALLLGELEAFHALLRSSSSNPRVQIKEENVAQSLHVLSRALEIESNAYCEELWLTHLRMSELLTTERNVNAEQETTEQALGFLPLSVSLWRHLLQLQLSNLDSLEDAVAMYLGQLQIIAAASQQATQRDVNDAFSVLLCDIVVQLCALCCSAGRPDKASSFLWSFVARKIQDEETAMWKQIVRGRVIGDDLLILYGLHVHIALFGEVPLWLRERAFRESDTINIYRLLLPVSSDLASASARGLKEGQRICGVAFEEFGDPEFVPPGLEVLRHNWVVIVAYDASISTAARLKKLVDYVDVARKWIALLPRVWTALACAFQEVFDKPDIADQLIEELMSKYKENTSTRYERFGEALHHYLIHQPRLFSAPNALIRTQFPTLPFLVSRLIAMLPACDPVYSRRAFKRILEEIDPIAQQEALRTAFHTLFRDTLDFVAKSQLGEGIYDEQDSAQDTYYLLAQAQLMSQACGPQDAIDALELCVIQGGSSKWSVLPRECRRLVWSTRFMLQCELLKLQPSDANVSRELLVLLKRYCVDIGPVEDTNRTIKRQLQACLGNMEGEEGAVPAMRRAVSTCFEHSSSSSATTSPLDMELFRLCLHYVSIHERPSQFAAFQPHLVAHPSFLLEYLDAVIQESDSRRVRNALRHKTLQESTPLDAATLRTLVLLDVKDKNVHGLVQILHRRTKADPLERISWEMFGKLEVMFGARESARAEEFAAALAKTDGVQLCSSTQLSDLSKPLTSSTEWRESGTAMTRLPPAYCLGVSLQVLDLSHNLLVSLPSAVCQLTHLRQLNLTGNSLVSLPATIGQLFQLETIGLAHNNLTEIPNAFWDGLVRLREVDLRYNALPGLSPRVLRLVELQSLRVVGNNFAWTDLQHIASKLPSTTAVDIRPVLSVASDNETNVTVKNPEEDVAMEDGETQQQPAIQAAREVTESDTLPKEQAEERRSKEEEDMVIDLSETKEEDEDAKPKTNEPREVVDVAPSTSTGDIEVPKIPEPSTRRQIASGSKKTPSERTDSDDEVQFLGSSPSKTLPITVPIPGVSSPVIAPTHTPQAASPATPTQPSCATSGAAAPPVDRSSAEWRTAMTRLLNCTPGLLRKCTQCFADDPSGTHQRLNGLTMCVLCLQGALALVLEQHTASTKPTEST